MFQVFPTARLRASPFYASAVAEGMTSLRQTALEKVRQGITTLKEINRVSFIEQA